MKRLIVLILLSTVSFATVTSPNSHQDTGTGTTVSSTAFTATAGNLIFLACAAGAGTFSLNTPTDSGGNTWTANQGTTAFGTTQVRTWFSILTTGFTGTVSCHTSTSTFQLVEYMELTGVYQPDVTSTADNISVAASSPWASNTLATVAAADVLISYVVNDSVSHTYTPPSGFTVPAGDNHTDTAMAFMQVSSIVNQTYSWTGTGAADNVAVGISSFKLALGLQQRRAPLWF